ncbi:putative DNA binding protein [Senna tora]|uniref:Putative DNA binding protein n=1 Tax=Senna tora TaxID=362788 RepID=A0A834XE76_9FABA|nr:putative DNA binding protein [Senna tora]
MVAETPIDLPREKSSIDYASVMAPIQELTKIVKGKLEEQHVNFANLGEFAGKSGKDHYFSLTNTSWIVDTGASSHMCFNKDLLINLRVLEKYNLLSVNKLVKDNGVSVFFNASSCVIQDQKTKDALVEGRLLDNLYVLKCDHNNACNAEKFKKNANSVNSTHKSNNSALGKASFMLWHQRLGHAPTDVLKHIDAINMNSDCLVSSRSRPSSFDVMYSFVFFLPSTQIDASVVLPLVPCDSFHHTTLLLLDPAFAFPSFLTLFPLPLLSLSHHPLFSSVHENGSDAGQHNKKKIDIEQNSRLFSLRYFTSTARDSIPPKSVKPRNLNSSAMDLSNHNKYFQPSSLLSPSNGDSVVGLEKGSKVGLFGRRSKENPFEDSSFPDPLCKLNLRETSEFVKSFPMMSNGNNGSSESRGGCFLQGSAQRRKQEEEEEQQLQLHLQGSNNSNSVITNRRLETPSTPGRPVFCFSSVGNLSRKSFPSKWDDAEKWLISTTTTSSCGHGSPAHTVFKVSETSSKIHISRQCGDGDFKKHIEDFSDKTRVTEERVSKAVPSFQGSVSLDHHNTDIVLKDKFTDNTHRYSEPTKEAFVFRNHGSEEGMKDACTEVVHEVQHRDVGTEMTPLGSSTTSRCHTPFKSSSPARHNTPASRSGPLAPPNPNETSCTIDVIQLEECHFAKLQLGTQYDSVTSNWSSREEEEEEISKSLRHNPSRKADSDCRAATWEEEEKTKCCFRYQREEAKIQAWVNLQSAKAEAQSRKLEAHCQGHARCMRDARHRKRLSRTRLHHHDGRYDRPSRGENTEDEIKPGREIDEEDGNGSQKSRGMERSSEETALRSNPEGLRTSTQDDESP